MKTKSIGDIIFYMHNNKVESKPILGISIYAGKCDILMGSNKDIPYGQTQIIYHTGSYAETDHKDAYDSLNQLMLALTENLVGKENTIKEELLDGTSDRES